MNQRGPQISNPTIFEFETSPGSGDYFRIKGSREQLSRDPKTTTTVYGCEICLLVRSRVGCCSPDSTTAYNLDVRELRDGRSDSGFEQYRKAIAKQLETSADVFYDIYLENRDSPQAITRHTDFITVSIEIAAKGVQIGGSNIKEGILAGGTITARNAEDNYNKTQIKKSRKELKKMEAGYSAVGFIFEFTVRYPGGTSVEFGMHMEIPFVRNSLPRDCKPPGKVSMESLQKWQSWQHLIFSELSDRKFVREFARSPDYYLRDHPCGHPDSREASPSRPGSHEAPPRASGLPPSSGDYLEPSEHYSNYHHPTRRRPRSPSPRKPSVQIYPSRDTPPGQLPYRSAGPVFEVSPTRPSRSGTTPAKPSSQNRPAWDTTRGVRAGSTLPTPPPGPPKNDADYAMDRLEDGCRVNCNVM